MTRMTLSPPVIAQFVIALFLAAASTPCLSAGSGPYEGGTFQGRIAYSADGNHNDPDDWAASPMSLALFAASGLKGRVVHFDYNCILPLTDPEWEKKHADGVLGAAQHFGYDLSLFHDCRKDLDGAVDSIARAINDSSAENPLYFIVAGPMQVPVLGIEKSDPEKRKHVYCISHSSWNDGLVRRYSFTHTKRDVIAKGVNWVQIQGQNRLLAFGRFGEPAVPELFEPYFWMRDADDPKVKFLWERMVVSTRPDPSDSGMAYFLICGDEEATPEKYRRLLIDGVVPKPVGSRDSVRIDAENFVTLDGYVLEYQDRRTTSHGVAVKMPGSLGLIGTTLKQPYMAETATYDVEVRYLDDPNRRSTFTLFVNGERQGQPWESKGTGTEWTSHTIPGVTVNLGDEIAVEANGTPGKLDYVQLNRRAHAVSDTTPTINDTGKLPRAVKSRMFLLTAVRDFSTINVDGFVPYARGGGVLSVDSTKYPDKFAAAQTRFTGDAGTYNVTIETTAESDGESTYVLSVNGVEIGRVQNPVHEGDIRDHSFHAYYTWRDVAVTPGDTIQVASNSHSNGQIPENGGYAWARGRWKSLLIIPANR